MSIAEILLPVFVQVVLIFVLAMWMGLSRVAAIRSGQTRMADIALGQKAWPERIIKIGNAYDNQFQLPVLFLLLVAFAMITRRADFIFVLLSWIFVATRIVHAVLHVGRNYVPHRFYAFLAGAIVLIIMWLRFAVQILVVV